MLTTSGFMLGFSGFNLRSLNSNKAQFRVANVDIEHRVILNQQEFNFLESSGYPSDNRMLQVRNKNTKLIH